MSDPVDEGFSSDVTYRQAIADAYRGAMADFKQYQYWDGIKKLGNPIGKAIVEKIYRPFLSLEDILHNNKLSPRQKGFDMTLKVIGGLAFVPVVLGALIGGSALIAPMMFLCSCIETAKNFAFWRAERAERNILRKEMITTKAMETAIDEAPLNDNEKAILKTFAFKEAAIYSALYKMREKIIHDSKQTFAQKQPQVAALNAAIEAFSKGTLKSEAIREISQSIPIEEQNQLLSDIFVYNQACDQINKQQIKAKKSLLDTIELYKIARAEIHSQNLPESIKTKMVEMIERKKNTIDDARDLEVRLVNHFINISHLQKNSTSEMELFDSPRIQKIDDRRHIIDLAKSKLQAALAKYAPSAAEKLDERKNEQEAKRIAQENATVQVFKSHGFNIKVIEDKMRLEHLEKATPKRLVITALTAGGAFLHGILVLGIPAMAAASGPAAAASITTLASVLTGLSVALGVTSYGSALLINRQENKRAEALTNITQSGENASYEMSPEEVKTYKESLANKKEKKLSHRAQAYLPRMMKFVNKKKNPEATTLERSEPINQQNDKSKAKGPK